ncbi:MAG: sugar ABC transporter permease [Anaerolineales bacterium]|nr:sugar ABC transporter permease [Anaerolineales bacterium]
MVRTRRLWTGLFLSLPLTIYIVIVVAPLLVSFYYSLTDWNGFNPEYSFVGAENFLKIGRDPQFFGAIRNTVVWMVAAIFLPSLGGLAIALALNGRGFAGNIYKSLFFLPICLSLVVIGQVWIWMYHPDWGLVNTVLSGLGLDGLRQAWLANPQTALWSVIIAWSWQQMGLAMVIFLAGLTSVPKELTEAAEIDGANYWQSLRRVVIPLLGPATVVVIALAIINSLKSFDIVYVMTQGGPFHSSDTLAMFMYNESFKKYYMGYGSAIAVVLFLISLVLISFYFRQVRIMNEVYD